MKEKEYINVSALARISTAIETLSHLVPDNLTHVIEEADRIKVMRTLSKWQDKLFSIIETEEDEIEPEKKNNENE